ncbi:MAG: hypothetical protein U0270_31695 [Labilithrix sp.]
MLKRVALSLVGSVLFIVACSPPEPQASFRSDHAETDADESEDTAQEDDEDCVEEDRTDEDHADSDDATKTLAPKGAGSLSGLDPASLDACACTDGGAARCVPSDQIPASFSSQLAACDKGVCVPDSLIKSGGAAPKQCKSIVGDGRCMSLCIPRVAEKKDVLDRGEGDVCGGDERCVPCINPLEGNKPTGVCEIGASSKSGSSSSSGKKKCGPKKPSKSSEPATSSGDDGGTCPYKGAPIDTSKFASCGDGGRCVPPSLVPEGQRSRLDTCAGGLCAPEKSVANAGKFLPPTCVSVAGAEGRCLSTVIKDIAAKKGLLPQSTCEANELCAPCFSPTDGSDTGACSSVSCDAPKEKPRTFAACCEGKGKCVPESSVTNASQKERLDAEGCQEGAELCAPTEDIGRTTRRPSCSGTIKLLGKAYQGACVSRCTHLGIKGFFLDQASCDGDHVCAPCVDPTSGQSTGACD